MTAAVWVFEIQGALPVVVKRAVAEEMNHVDRLPVSSIVVQLLAQRRQRRRPEELEIQTFLLPACGSQNLLVRLAIDLPQLPRRGQNPQDPDRRRDLD